MEPPVNIPIIEPFNEIDQTLTYGAVDMTIPKNAHNCAENNLNWPADPGLPAIISQWVSNISQFVRGEVDLGSPTTSPLGYDKKLFLMSYARSDPNMNGASNYYAPFTNPDVDLIDAHRGMYSGEHELSNSFENSQDFRNNYTSTANGVTYKKPFHQGESNYYEGVDHDNDPNTDDYDAARIFHNYDVSFHNELWSSAFSGNFATSLTWHWERVFWWPDALPWAPNDDGNPTPWSSATHQFSNVLGDTNILDVGGLPVPVINRTTYHHFKPLADLLANPNWQSDDFFNSAYTPHKYHDPVSGVECYYLMNADNTLAIGWVHNLNGWVMNSFYLASSNQNFLGCTAPGAQTIALTGFQAGLDYHISWFPTRMNDTIHPADAVDSSGTGTVLLDMSTAPMGDTLNRYLDTLRLDYAFVISIAPVLRNMLAGLPADTVETTDWDFSLYPNPARDELRVLLPPQGDKQVTLYDLTGRMLRQWPVVRGVLVHIPTADLSSGPYCIRVFSGADARTKIFLKE